MNKTLMRLTNFLSIMLLIGLLVSGCIPSHQQEKGQTPNREIKVPDNGSENQLNGKDMKLQLHINEGLFHSVAGWKDNETIFYILNDDEGSEVHTYNLYSGESELFYHSDVPIVQMAANAEKNLFLIHTSPSSYEADLIFLNKRAEIQYQTKINSFELSFTWNQANPSQIFLTSFKEDWTFDTYLIDLNEEKMVENPIEIPFIQWMDSVKVSYLKWDLDTPSLAAPLYLYDLDNQSEKLIAENVVANTNFNDLLTTIELIDDNGTAVVRFYHNDDQKKFAEMPTRLVALYSDWSIPYHDMDSRENLYYIFEVNEEKTDFSLVSFSPERNEKEVVIEKIKNFPIKLSPNGEYALYGPRYEKLIDLKKQSIKELIKLN